MNSIQIQESIKNKENQLKDMQRKMVELNCEIDTDRAKLITTIEQERDETEVAFFRSLGIKDYEVNVPAINFMMHHMYIVFTEKAIFKEVINAQEKFNGVVKLRKWVLQNELYSHPLSSFQGRPTDWYSLSLREKLENLEWKFDKHGNVMKN